MHVTFVGYSWNIQGIFLYSIFLEHYLGIFPGIREPFPNIPGIYYGNVPRIFHEHIFARWVVCWILREWQVLPVKKCRSTNDKMGDFHGTYVSNK